MQTFLPYPDFAASAASLDNQRLGKQRVEAHQILRAIENPLSGWRHHPTIGMWRGHSNALGLYMNACIEEWVRRGFNNNMALHVPDGEVVLPPWFGDPRLHASHRGNLLRKAPTFYARYGWTESPEMPYYWPRPPFTSTGEADEADEADDASEPAAPTPEPHTAVSLTHAPTP